VQLLGRTSTTRSRSLVWRADSVEQLIAGGVRTSKLDPFKPYLHQRLSAGARNGTALHAEIAKQGYTGSYPPWSDM